LIKDFPTTHPPLLFTLKFVKKKNKKRTWRKWQRVKEKRKNRLCIVVGEFDVRLSTSSKFSLTEQKKKKTKIQIPCPFFLLGTASNPNNKKREWAAAAGRLSTVSCTHY
jgi:hypothetical protein